MSDAEDIWRRRSDEQLAEAVQRLDEYTDEGRDVIRAELRRRGGSITKLHAESRRREAIDARERSLDRTASIGARLACQILDSMIALVASVLLAIAGGIMEETITGETGTIGWFFGPPIGLFYVLFADGFKNGQSYAKRLMELAVVDAVTGKPCTFFKSFVRNVFLSLLGPFDWMFIFSESRQRLGDRVANTIVITTRRR